MPAYVNDLGSYRVASNILENYLANWRFQLCGVEVAAAGSAAGAPAPVLAAAAARASAAAVAAAAAE